MISLDTRTYLERDKSHLGQLRLWLTVLMDYQKRLPYLRIYLRDKGLFRLEKGKLYSQDLDPLATTNWVESPLRNEEIILKKGT